MFLIGLFFFAKFLLKTLIIKRKIQYKQKIKERERERALTGIKVRAEKLPSSFSIQSNTTLLDTQNLAMVERNMHHRASRFVDFP
ncbi:hypothetical protein ACB098_08G051300 [Castanea mollissima]